MTPDVVVDIGNTRLKFGHCEPDQPGIRAAAALPDEPDRWAQLCTEWQLPDTALFAISSVNASWCARFVEWAVGRGSTVFVFEHHTQIGLPVTIDSPESVGFDRLFNARAVLDLVEPGTPVIVADIGTAVTVDLVDSDGAFAGGSIFPGLRLMAKALHHYTDKLPLIEPPPQPVAPPGTSTRMAIESGTVWAVAGGIDALVTRLAAGCVKSPSVYLTGGDAAPLKNALAAGMNFRFHVRPVLTLEGIRLAAEALP